MNLDTYSAIFGDAYLPKKFTIVSSNFSNIVKLDRPNLAQPKVVYLRQKSLDGYDLSRVYECCVEI